MISTRHCATRAFAPVLQRGRWLAFLLSVPCVAGAQVIRGRVVDSTGTPVPLAQVRVVPQGDGAITDLTGAFVLGPLAPGNYSLAIRRFGFSPDTVSVTVPLPDSVLTIKLTPIPVLLAAVTTKALQQDLPRLFDRMHEHIGGVEFGADLRKKYDGMAPDEILRYDFNLSRYLHQYSSAFKRCYPPVFFLDGIKLDVALDGGGTVRLSNYVRLSDIAAIETFTSPDFVHEPFIDGEFEPGYCGSIVLIWTNGYKAEKWVSFKQDSSRRP